MSRPPVQHGMCDACLERVRQMSTEPGATVADVLAQLEHDVRVYHETKKIMSAYQWYANDAYRTDEEHAKMIELRKWLKSIGITYDRKPVRRSRAR
jgi:hypothetical protein